MDAQVLPPKTKMAAAGLAICNRLAFSGPRKKELAQQAKEQEAKTLAKEEAEALLKRPAAQQQGALDALGVLDANRRKVTERWKHVCALVFSDSLDLIVKQRLLVSGGLLVVEALCSPLRLALSGVPSCTHARTLPLSFPCNQKNVSYTPMLMLAGLTA